MIPGTFMGAEISVRNFYIPQKLTLNIVILAKYDFFSTYVIKQKFLHPVRNFCKKKIKF